jgi:pimeloyl-ACP methyl ester carboxylesterase
MGLELDYTVVGDGPPILILHGLFGSARNWSSFAKGLAETHRVYVLDLRNHGNSPWSPAMSYREMAEDVRDFMVRHGLAGAAVLGHSMGGKTAMVLALHHGDLVGALSVVDIAPVAYGHTHLPFIEAMAAVDLTSATRRSQVDEHLKPAIEEPMLRSFLLQNLVTKDGALAWRINLAALAANMDALIGFPAETDGRSYGGPTLFAAGANSDYLRSDHHEAIQQLFPAAEIHVIPEAGHWVHAEQPEALHARVKTFLEAV